MVNDDCVAESCERCHQKLSYRERGYAMELCDRCYDHFSGNCSFRRYRRKVLINFCAIASFLEFSINAGVIATFQPIAVTHFDWGPDTIASVNFIGAGLSVLISLTLAQCRLPEKSQSAVAAGLYLLSVVIFTVPPVSQWRVVLGLMLGIKAQILFMAPFTAVFSRLIGRVRVTNSVTMLLCLAPAIGGALGTAAAPAFVAVTNTPLFMLSAVPAAVAALALACSWRSAHVYSDSKSLSG